jgi:hypothetical protein
MPENPLQKTATSTPNIRIFITFILFDRQTVFLFYLYRKRHDAA